MNRNKMITAQLRTASRKKSLFEETSGSSNRQDEGFN